jgi:hypothetical protein
MRDIQNYIQIKESFKNELKDIANVNNVTMGTPTSYVGFKTQQNSAAIASNSIQYSISGILQLWADASSLALENMRQRVIKEPGNPIFENLLGDEGINMIMDTKDIPFSQWMLYISTQDIIDPARKERMLRAMDMLMQSGQVNWRDWIEVEDAKTISQLKDYSSYAVAKKKFDMEQQQAQQMAAAQQQQQMAAQSQIQGKQIDAESRMAQTAQNNTAKLADTALKQTGDPQVVAEMMDGGQGQQGSQQQQMTPEQQEQMMQG